MNSRLSSSLSIIFVPVINFPVFIKKFIGWETETRLEGHVSFEMRVLLGGAFFIQGNRFRFSNIHSCLRCSWQTSSR